MFVNHIGGKMVSVFALSAVDRVFALSVVDRVFALSTVDRVFEPRSGQTRQ